jgi:hypothetical protein
MHRLSVGQFDIRAHTSSTHLTANRTDADHYGMISGRHRRLLAGVRGTGLEPVFGVPASAGVWSTGFSLRRVFVAVAVIAVVPVVL